MYIDTHCHLTDEKLKHDLKTVVDDFINVGVNRVIDIGCCLESSILAKNQADEFPSVYFTAGVHPSDSNTFNDSVAAEIYSLAKHDKCVGIGEIGLDYYWKPFDKEVQKKAFIEQLIIAKELNLPVSFHVRDAMGDALSIIKDNKDKLPAGGVMHCYAGSIESARELEKFGLYFAFGGTLTFKNARNIPEVAAALPLERILTETDSPYLAPEGFRGTVNSPKHIPVIAKKLATVRGMDILDLESALESNARRLFYKMK